MILFYGSMILKRGVKKTHILYNPAKNKHSIKSNVKYILYMYLYKYKRV